MCLKNVALTSNLPKLVFGYLHIAMNNGISMLYVINNDQMLYRLERNLVHIRTLHSHGGLESPKSEDFTRSGEHFVMRL